jgi:hypothetical protein
MGSTSSASQHISTLGPSARELVQFNLELAEFRHQHWIKEFWEVGKRTLERFFEGNDKLFRSRSKSKTNSISRLAALPGAPYGKQALLDRVGVYLALRTLMPLVEVHNGLTASHIVAVLSLGEDARHLYLKQAVEQSWSARMLRQRVVCLHRESGERRGRPSSRAVYRGVNLLERCARAMADARERLTVFAALDADLTQRARASLQQIAEHASSLAAQLGTEQAACGAKRVARSSDLCERSHFLRQSESH